MKKKNFSISRYSLYVCWFHRKFPITARIGEKIENITPPFSIDNYQGVPSLSFFFLFYSRLSVDQIDTVILDNLETYHIEYVSDTYGSYLSKKNAFNTRSFNYKTIYGFDKKIKR